MFIEEETACATHATHATQKLASVILRDLRCVRDGRRILHCHQFRFYHTIPPVLVGCASLFYKAVNSRSFEKGMGCCRTGTIFPARAIELSKCEIAPAW